MKVVPVCPVLSRVRLQAKPGSREVLVDHGMVVGRVGAVVALLLVSLEVEAAGGEDNETSVGDVDGISTGFAKPSVVAHADTYGAIVIAHLRGMSAQFWSCLTACIGAGRGMRVSVNGSERDL